MVWYGMVWYGMVWCGVVRCGAVRCNVKEETSLSMTYNLQVKSYAYGFYHIWAWRPSWSCDVDQLYKLWFPFPRRLHIKFGFDWPSGLGGEDV